MNFLGKSLKAMVRIQNCFIPEPDPVFWGLQCHVEPDPNCFICYYRGQRKFFILDPSGKISIVHDSDIGSGYGTMRIRIQTMLFGCFYSDLLQKNSLFL